MNTSKGNPSVFWDDVFSHGPLYGTRESTIMPRILPFLEWPRVVVVGGGYGRNAAFVARQGHYTVVNADYSSQALALGQKRYAGVGGLSFSSLDIMNADAGTDFVSHDSVVCLYLLSHFEGRRLQVVLANLFRLWNGAGNVITNFLSPEDDECRAGVVFGFTLEEARRACAEAGFSIVHSFEHREKRYLNIMDNETVTVSNVFVLK